jgi:hypothetical protein
MTTLKQNPMLLGAVLIVGAMLYTRSRTAQAKPATNSGLPTRMPGSAGTGTSQIAGGIVNDFFRTLGMAQPPSVAPYATAPEFNAYVLQNHEVPLGEFMAGEENYIPGISGSFGTLT